MIAVRIETGFLVYLVVMLVALCGLAVWEMWRRRVQEWSVSEEQLAQCTECNYTFIVRRNEAVARCPRCLTLCPMRRR